MSEEDYREILRDLPRRRKVWEVIAEFYLDPGWMDAVVRVSRESGYSWEELDHIARYEVTPSLYFKWDYLFAEISYRDDPFINPDGLAAYIVKKIGRRHPGFLVKLLGRRMMRPMEEKWREVERRFKAGEGAEPHPSD